MFDRKKYKKYALSMLKKRWQIPLLMTLVCLILMTLLELPNIRSISSNYYTIAHFGTEVITETESETSLYSNLREFFSILIQYVLIFAQLSVYLKMSRSPNPVSGKDFIEGFALWARAILSCLWETLWTFLWMLLFIIPGFVKHYAYSMTKYLVIEFEELSVTKALRVSIAITRGHKAELFIMDLSFLGWLILATLSCGVGLLWLIPYREMSMINAYHSLLKEAVTSGIITKDDLEG
ncbi:MAG: DUF975 family protein [Treponema sp.]|nr:DUF975 family protein [Treponema sp.]